MVLNSKTGISATLLRSWDGLRPGLVLINACDRCVYSLAPPTPPPPPPCRPLKGIELFFAKATYLLLTPEAEIWGRFPPIFVENAISRVGYHINAGPIVPPTSPYMRMVLLMGIYRLNSKCFSRHEGMCTSTNQLGKSEFPTAEVSIGHWGGCSRAPAVLCGCRVLHAK